MTEAEWGRSANSTRMLAYLRERGVSGRKLRLFAAACCRLIQLSIPTGHHRKLLDVVEQHADGVLGWGMVELLLRHASRASPVGEAERDAAGVVRVIAGRPRITLRLTPSRLATRA